MLNDVIHNPPSWIVAIIIALLTAHAIDTLIEYVARRRSHNGLIPILELFIVFVLGFLALHAHYEGMLATEHHEGWYNPYLVPRRSMNFSGHRRTPRPSSFVPLVQDRELYAP